MHPHLPGWTDSQGRAYNRRDPLRLMDDLECSERSSQDCKSVRKPYVSSPKLVSTSKVEARKTAKCVGDYRAFLFGKKESKHKYFNQSNCSKKLTSGPPVKDQTKKDCKMVTKVGDFRKRLFCTDKDALISSAGQSPKLASKETIEKNTSSHSNQLTFENLTDYLNSFNTQTPTIPIKRKHSGNEWEGEKGCSSTGTKKRRFNC